MEYIIGKQSYHMNRAEFLAYVADYREIWVDIGTGDGCFVQHLARQHPDRFVIGLDACRENLLEVSRKCQPNALYLIANAEMLPPELEGVAHAITINFAWGSLLHGLLEGHTGLLDGLQRLAKPNAPLSIKLNGSALLKVGWSFGQSAGAVQRALMHSGFVVECARAVASDELRTYPTTWAKRLAFGRKSECWLLEFRNQATDDRYQVSGVRILRSERVTKILVK